jgi:hypothetical protein
MLIVLLLLLILLLLLLLLLLMSPGGMWLDAYTLDAMGQGVLYALPLLACSVASRTPLSRPFPVLREMHELQHDLLKHFTAGVAPTCTVPSWIIYIMSAERSFSSA